MLDSVILLLQLYVLFRCQCGFEIGHDKVVVSWLVVVSGPVAIFTIIYRGRISMIHMALVVLAWQRVLRLDLEVGYMFVLEDASLAADGWRDELGLLALVLIPVQLTSLRLLRKVIRRLVLHIDIFYVYIYSYSKLL